MNRRLQMGCGESLRNLAQRNGTRELRAGRPNAGRGAAEQPVCPRKRAGRRG